MTRISSISIFALLAGQLLSGVAAAESAPTQSAASAPSDELETVVVTAQKRTESIREVPISISAVSGTDIADQHIVNVEDITRTMPGISFGAGAGTGRDIITIRGIASQGGNATVGIYLDDVPVQTQLPFNSSYSGATEPKLFDLNDVEVLRGPQGTLYGAGSMGGTIRYTTNKPDLDNMIGNVSADVSGTDHGSVNSEEIAIFNYPILPGIAAVRVGLDYDIESGWIKRYAAAGFTEAAALAGVVDSPAGPLLQTGTNSSRELSGRIAFLYRPDDALSIQTTFFGQRLYSDDTSVFYDYLGTYNNDKLVPERSRDTTFIPSLTVNGDLGWADLTSVTSYFWRQNARITDSTYYNSDFFEYLADYVYPDTAKCACGVGFDFLPSPGYTTQKTATTTEEFRLASKLPGENELPITWVGGLFISDRKFHLSDDEIIPGVAAEFIKLYGVPPQDTGFDDPMTDGAVGLQGGREDERQYAAYGEASYAILPDLKVTAGLRYVLAKTSLTYYELAYFNQGLPPVVSANQDYHFTTPKVSATYDVSPQATVYADLSEGYRLGGFVLPIQDTSTSLCTPELAAIGLSKPSLTYSPDHLWSYEAGAKTSFFDNHLTINAAGYWVDWRKVQQSFFFECGAAYTANFGTAESHGGELEIKARPMAGLTVGVSGGWTRAVLTSVTPDVGATVGEKLLNTPDWSTTFKAEYAFELTDEIGAFVRGDYDLVGRSHGSFQQSNPDYSRPTYAILNASFGAAMGDYELSIYGKNLTNTNKDIQHVAINELVSAYAPRPLTVGMTFKAKF